MTPPTPAPRFRLGQLVATPGALAALAAAGASPLAFLARHARGDWGEVPPKDAAENAFSLAHGFRLLSSYRYDPADPAARVWVITEADRSATTVLLPSEYKPIVAGGRSGPPAPLPSAAEAAAGAPP